MLYFPNNFELINVVEITEAISIAAGFKASSIISRSEKKMLQLHKLLSIINSNFSSSEEVFCPSDLVHYS